MNPVLLQKQLRDNAADVKDFYEDLKTWGDSMKKKDKQVKQSSENKVPREKEKKKRPTKKETPKSKLGYTDYNAWDKFDADAACEDIDYDENEESDLSDECDESVRDEAYVEKEKGNKFVQEKKWNEAIECYTKAIGIYAYDPVFYANRALCLLKNNDFGKAESDCTMSIKLDATYVKAYQRRAAAREAVGKLEEAELDLLEVLKLEPKNKESKKNLEVLQEKIQKQKTTEQSQKPVSKFTASRNKRKTDIEKIVDDNKRTYYINKENVNSFKQDDSIITVKEVVKPVALQSKKPLKRIDIVDVEGVNTEVQPSLFKKQRQSSAITSSSTNTFDINNLNVIERQSECVHEEMEERKNEVNKRSDMARELCAPVNSVQFYSQWRQFKNLDDKYVYLKLIKPEKIPEIFKESLESDVFSEILEILVKFFLLNGDLVFSFLVAFSKMKRFSTILLFVTQTDKKYLLQLFDHVRQYEKNSPEEVELLLKKYEL